MPSLLGDYLPYTQGQSYIPTRRDLSVSGRNLAAMTAGFPGDIASFVPGSQTSLLGGLPTSDELVSRFGGDPQHISYWPAAVAAPGPGELKAAATGLLNLAPDAARAVADTGLLNYAMTLFHGTPHKFDVFDLKKIGTGEGAQAYGHGLYFAESPGVAKSYQKDLTRETITFPDASPELNSVISREFRDADFSVLDEVQAPKDIPEDWWGYLAESIEEGGDPAVANELRKIDKSTVQVSKGHLYEVDIPDETIDKMLDWDAPLSEQPEAKEAFRKAFEWRLEHGNNIQRGQADYALRVMMNRSHTHGSTFYQQLAALDPEDASKLLNEAGIPGIRYYDGNSRNSPSATRNIVVFNPDDIKSVKRDGELVYRSVDGNDLSMRIADLQTGSEPLVELFTVDGDGAANLANTLNLDSVTPADLKATRDAVKQVTQRALKDLPEKITVYRGGGISGDVVPVTTNKAVAQRFADRAGVPLRSFVVSKNQILADVDAVNRLGWNRPSFYESELLVRAKDLQ